MRPSNESRDPSRERHKYYMGIAKGVVYPGKHYTVEHFASYMVFFEDVFNALFDSLPQTTKNSVDLFIEAEQRTLGVPLPEGAPWDDKVNVRGPFWTVVPGMISEMIAAADLYERHDYVNHPQDRLTQDKRAIDLIVGKGFTSVQVKTAQCKGRDFWIDPEWVKNQAEYVSLVDIDEHEHYYIRREVLEELVNQYIRDTVLEAKCDGFWDKHPYPKRGDSF